MDRKWLYPYYVIVILALVLFFFGCDGEGAEAFSVEVQVEDATDMPGMLRAYPLGCSNTGQKSGPTGT